MPKVYNRARVNTATTGTGTITLGSAVSGYQTFASAGAANSDVVHYTIEEGINWEIGTGTYSSTGPTLTRTLVQSSTGSLLSLTGTAQVFITAPASSIQGGVEITGGTITGLSSAIPVASGGTGVATLTGLAKGNGTSAFSAAVAGTDYLDPAAIGSTVQGYDADLQAIGALAGTSGILTKTAANTWSLDTNTYLTTSSASSTYQPLDADLTAIGSLAGTSGFLKKTAANTWSLDTSTYLTSAVSTISFGTTGLTPSTATSGAVTVGGTLAVANGGTGAATLTGIVKGNGTGAFSAAVAGTDFLAPSAIGSTVQGYDADLQAIGALAGTSGILTKTAANTWSLDTNTYLTTGTAASTYQPLDADLTAIAVLAGTSGFLKKTAANTWALETTAYAPLASPALTGTPTAPTAAVDTNTTQLATTDFVVRQAGTGSPAMNGTAQSGISMRYARQDHVHPTDTSRAPLVSPALTGTPTAPTASAGTNTTQIATTAFVAAALGGRLLRAPQVLTSGTSYTTPAGCKGIYVEAVGGGGGSGGGATGGSSAGGGAGAYCAKYFTVTPSTAYTYAIGAGGTAGASSSSTGGNGGSTTFTVGVTTITAGGGTGSATTSTVGGGAVAGGTATNGDINARGSYSTGIVATTQGGNGGASFFGGSTPNSSTAIAGLFGSGGSGINGGSARVGAAGGAGVIRIWEFS